MGGNRVTTFTVTSLLRPATVFQRSVNLKLDAGSLDRLDTFTPTPSLVTALNAVLSSASSSIAQRAHHIYGAYGTGKSTLAVVLAALLDPSPDAQASLAAIVDRLDARGYHETAALVEGYISSGRKLLPVMFSDDEGPLEPTLLRGLKRALTRAGISDLRPLTAYASARSVIERWKTDYPTTYQHLQEQLESVTWTVDDLLYRLDEEDPYAYQVFLDLYPSLTSGSQFDEHFGQSAKDVYEATAEKLAEHGYQGMCLLYDEFGRYLEGVVARAAHRELAHLQDFAEFCSRTSGFPVQLVVISHKTFGEYAASGRVGDEASKEWRRIEGRFAPIPITTDPDASAYLIAGALTKQLEPWEAFRSSHHEVFEQMRRQVIDHLLFPGHTNEWIDEVVLTGAYPLHPVTAACLPLLSEQVAQNERTLFTFLTSDEPSALLDLLSKKEGSVSSEFIQITLDDLYDYFEPAIRADVGPSGKRRVWMSASRALAQVGAGDALASRLIKALAILHASGVPVELRPSTGLLSFAVDSDYRSVETALHRLREAKLIIFRQNTGYWEFFLGSGVDVSGAINQTIETHRFSIETLRRIMVGMLRPVSFVAGLHNDAYSIRRRFPLEYMSLADFQHWSALDYAGWDSWLGERHYDGVVIGILAETYDDLQMSLQLAQTVEHPRVLISIPRQPLKVFRSLRNYAAIKALLSDPVFLGQDPLVKQELEFLADDETQRVETEIQPLIDPLDSRWFHEGKEVLDLRSPRRVNTLVSRICDQVFSRTIPIRYEPLNRRKVSSAIARASRTVIECLLNDDPLPAGLGLTGKGPDVMIYHSVLIENGFAQEHVGRGTVTIGEPDRTAFPNAHAIWCEVREFCQRALGSEVRLSELLTRLTLPPYGLRTGVLPVILAAGLRDYLGCATIRQGFQPVKAILGSTLLEMVANPTQFTLQIENVFPQLRLAVFRILDKQFGRFITAADKRGQPLFIRARGFHRWWQGLDRYAREATLLSSRAASLCRLARNAFDRPLHVVLHDLPELLLPADFDVEAASDEEIYQALAESLGALVEEIEGMLPALEVRLQDTVCATFGGTSRDPFTAVMSWVQGLEGRTGVNPLNRGFNDVYADGLVRALQNGSEQLLDQLVKSLVGVATRDWSSSMEEQFAERLRQSRDVIEEELLCSPPTALEGVASVRVELPGAAPRQVIYRTEQSKTDKSEAVLNYLVSAFVSQTKSLTLDEKRWIAAEFFKRVVMPQ